MKVSKTLLRLLISAYSILLVSCINEDLFELNYYETNNKIFEISNSPEYLNLIAANNVFENSVLSKDTTKMKLECIIDGKYIYSQQLDTEFLCFIDAMDKFNLRFPEFSNLSISEKILCQSLVYNNTTYIDTLDNRKNIFLRTKSASPESYAIQALSGYLAPGQTASPNTTYELSGGNIKMKAWSSFETISKCRENSISTSKEWAGYIWFNSGILIEDINATATQMTIKHLNWERIPLDPIYLVHTHPNVVNGQNIQMSEADKASFIGLQDHIGYFVILAQKGAKKFYSTTDAGTYENM